MFILVPGFCLLGIGGAPYISPQIMAGKPYFHIFSSLLGSLCHTPGVVRRMSSVSTITTRNN